MWVPLTFEAYSRVSTLVLSRGHVFFIVQTPSLGISSPTPAKLQSYRLFLLLLVFSNSDSVHLPPLIPGCPLYNLKDPSSKDQTLALLPGAQGRST